MKAYTQGVSVSLTEQQVKKVQKVLKQRERCRNNFKRMLKHFGFKEIKDQRGSFTHKAHNWYAEIMDRETWSDVWMTGTGLKDSGGMPGGYIYGTPKEIEDEILSCLNKNNF